MAKLLFIHPQIRTNEPPQHPPYGALQLAGVVDQLGHKVGVLDNNALRLPVDAVRQQLKDDPWDIFCLTGLTTQYKFIRELVPIIRELYPAALIAGGGGWFTAQPLDMMRWLPALDVGCIGEGYKTLPEIIEHAEDRNWKNVKGIVYREGGKVKMTGMRPLLDDYYYCPECGITEKGKGSKYTFDEALSKDFLCPECEEELVNNLDEEIPFPAYEFSPVETYLMYSMMPYSPESMNPQCRRLDILAGYGCPWKCSFCFHLGASSSCLSKIYGKQVTGKDFRQHSPQYVVRLIQHLRMTYCINFASFMDENLTVNRKWFTKFCDLMEESGLATLVHWGMVCHSRTVDDDMLKRGKDVGLSYVSYGGESTSQKLLTEMGKGQTKEQMQAAIDATHTAGINPIMSFIIGFPHTTIDDLIGDAQFFLDNQIYVNPFFLTPYPGSKLYTEYKDKIIEQAMTDTEKEFLEKPDLSSYAKMLADSFKPPFDKREADAHAPETKSSLQKAFPILKEKIRDLALERWIASLDDATKLSVNLTEDFNDVELAGLRYMLNTWDISRLTKFKKTLDARKNE